MTWIQTRSGVAFDLLNPRPEDIRVSDIAWSLARICRYNGHTLQHYSVAQHCVEVSRALARDGAPQHLLFAGLIHDAAEAYVGDLTAPLKWASPALAEAHRAVERPIRDAICARMDAHPGGLEHAWVKEYDARILLDESEIVLGPKPKDWAIKGGRLGLTIRPWGVWEAASTWAAGVYWHRPDLGPDLVAGGLLAVTP